MCIAFLVVRTIISFAKPGTKSITNVLFCISITLRPFENELIRVELTRGCIIESKNQRSHSVIIFFFSKFAPVTADKRHYFNST